MSAPNIYMDNDETEDRFRWEAFDTDLAGYRRGRDKDEQIRLVVEFQHKIAMQKAASQPVIVF